MVVSMTLSVADLCFSLVRATRMSRAYGTQTTGCFAVALRQLIVLSLGLRFLCLLVLDDYLSDFASLVLPSHLARTVDLVIRCLASGFCCALGDAVYG